MTLLESFALSFGLALVVMAIAFFAVCRGTRIAWADVLWAYSVGAFATLQIAIQGEVPLRNVALSALILLWSLRLGVTLHRRVLRHTEEDGRYVAMRAAFGERALPKLAAFYSAQALIAASFSMPPAFAARVAGPFGWIDVLSLCIGLSAIFGESIADRQLARFRSNPANRGQVCRSGLWAYSRHPNYFFEWVHWWAYLPLAVSAGTPLLGSLGPALMFLFLFRVSGIPWTERQSLASRGAAYAAYQREVSPFIPWFPKRSRDS